MRTPIEGKFFNNEQEAFDFAYQWLIIDNKPRCILDGTNAGNKCLYRKETNEGTQTCVIGAMIPDSIILDPYLGINLQAGIDKLYDRYSVVSDWFRNVDKDLLVHIQNAHDSQIGLISRQSLMIRIAQQHGLKLPAFS